MTRQQYWNMRKSMYFLHKMALLIFLRWEAKDSEYTTLKPPKITSSCTETSPAKTNEKVEESIEKESLTYSETDNTGFTVSQDQTTILEHEKSKYYLQKMNMLIFLQRKQKILKKPY